ncbi:hypothetical protein Tco_0375398 [Tanacetum coccineum]
MDDTTDQFDDDADARLEEPTETATGIVQGKGNDAEMTEAQQRNENLETTQEQVVKDAHVTISNVPKKTEVPVTKVEAMPKSAWTEKDQIDNLLMERSYKAVRHRYSNPMIQPEPEGSTQGYPPISVEVLRFDTSAGNPVKEILLKLNLPDHRIFKDGGEGT